MNHHVDTRGVVIVGGGLAAVRTAQALRGAGYPGPVTIVGNEPHLPYDRPALSKDALRSADHPVTLQPAQFYADNDITLLLGVAARTVDTVGHVVTLADGRELHYDELVIATGLVPRRLASLPDLEGIRVLRSIDDSAALREHAGSVGRAVVVGAGFIGCEVAASLRLLGVEVVLVEAQAMPLASVLGNEIGALIARLHRDEGVDVRTGVGVAKVSGYTHVETVTLSDGTEIETDLVVVGIGSHPATDWLFDTGITVDDGVVCDEYGRASAPHVWAVGDVASWRNAVGDQVRVEHWSNVAEQARVLAPALLGRQVAPPVTVPYFWSDQYDVKIQCLGEPEADDTVHVVHDDGRKFLAFYERDGVVVGVVGAGLPGPVMRQRANIAAGVPIGEVL